MSPIMAFMFFFGEGGGIYFMLGQSFSIVNINIWHFTNDYSLKIGNHSEKGKSRVDVLNTDR